ncbi:MAG: M56 family metallopeptidase [Okeania sp. SIO2G4]|uniref:M56 family metallopeptidase n=1 Tax=unclassified Okeania TaxID=2634635 RepID=UPI0013BC6043|nr:MULTISPECIES: M56 family metallopeptidase [unclassified Okeania]NEP04836.1 M56 family metallopeptidase [Okeania sp. SIO4D6]NEP71056.1 M56 family metallopeptidase [Okeania sp. SIO2G5]NEP91524.1 M56 family metallopeptidase [Okeania sp. SIO2F5]NEQ89400.1 M56 family metallopeptidase [Okeania sp. SIO2G4]
MHLIIILGAVGLSYGLRKTYFFTPRNWGQRWERSLLLFISSPIILITTAIAVICMGPQGEMLGLSTGWLSYLLAWVFCGWTAILGLILGYEGWRSVQKVNNYPQIIIEGKSVRLLDTPILFSAQIGLWNSQLVVSKGLIERLNSEQLYAVLNHEQAHYYYRDTFWFFWLSWLGKIVPFLPNTEILWHELLTLREVRADQWAKKQVDGLLLAETLLLMVSDRLTQTANFAAAFSCTTPPNRLTERIDALLAEPDFSIQQNNYWFCSWILLNFFPLMTMLFHQ